MNLENEFEVIVKGNFTHVMSFLTIAQDIYNKSNEIGKYLENKNISKDISNSLSPFINVYFDEYTNYDIHNISKYAASLIAYEISELLPGAEHMHPNRINYIKITKDGKEYFLEENQSNEGIKKAQEYIIEWLQL